MNKIRIKKDNGFSLIELLITLFIISLVSMASISNYSFYIKETEINTTLSSLNKYKNSILLCVYKNGSKTDCNSETNNIPRGFSESKIKGISILVIEKGTIFISTDIINPKNQKLVDVKLEPILKKSTIFWKISCSDYKIGSIVQNCTEEYFQK